MKAIADYLFPHRTKYNELHDKKDRKVNQTNRLPLPGEKLCIRFKNSIHFICGWQHNCSPFL